MRQSLARIVVGDSSKNPVAVVAKTKDHFQCETHGLFFERQLLVVRVL